MAVMMAPREKWTDERLDDLNEKVDRGFTELKAEMREGFEKVDARFEKVDARFEKIDERFERIEDRFDKMLDRFHALNLTLLGGGAVVIATLIGGTFF